MSEQVEQMLANESITDESKQMMRCAVEQGNEALVKRLLMPYAKLPSTEEITKIGQSSVSLPV